TSLSRLWQAQGKRAEAHQLLAESYGWFTDGFETADLQEAKALLDALADAEGRASCEEKMTKGHIPYFPSLRSERHTWKGQPERNEPCRRRILLLHAAMLPGIYVSPPCWRITRSVPPMLWLSSPPGVPHSPTAVYSRIWTMYCRCYTSWD